MICAVADCQKQVAVASSGWCSSHYQRNRRWGSPTGSKPKYSCSIDSCETTAKIKGFCGLHYDRQKRNGDAVRSGPLRSKPHNWIIKHSTHTGDDCLIWPFSRNAGGYGKVELGGYNSAHRYMTKIVYGDPPTNKHHAAHSCHNGHLGCVNPKHLRWATQTENEADKVIAGNGPQGENHPLAKLSREDVSNIIELKGKLSQREIGKKFGVGSTTINKILNGRHWVLEEAA